MGGTQPNKVALKIEKRIEILTALEADILGRLKEGEERWAVMKKTANRFSILITHVHYVVKRMIRDGLIEYRGTRYDIRVHRTDKGRTLLENTFRYYEGLADVARTDS